MKWEHQFPEILRIQQIHLEPVLASDSGSQLAVGAFSSN